jgi:hypothetical protein
MATLWAGVAAEQACNHVTLHVLHCVVHLAIIHIMRRAALAAPPTHGLDQRQTSC